MDPKLRSRITRGLKKGDRVIINHETYYELSMDEASGQVYLPFLAIRVGRWWYLFRVPQAKPWTPGGWKPTLVMTFLERKPAAMQISNRLAQLLVSRQAKRRPNRCVAEPRCPDCRSQPHP